MNPLLSKEPWLREAQSSSGEGGTVSKLRYLVETGKASPDQQEEFWKQLSRYGIDERKLSERARLDRLEALKDRAMQSKEYAEEFFRIANYFFLIGLGSRLSDEVKEVFWRSYYHLGPSSTQPRYSSMVERIRELKPRATAMNPRDLGEYTYLCVLTKSLDSIPRVLAEAAPWTDIYPKVPHDLLEPSYTWELSIPRESPLREQGPILDLLHRLDAEARFTGSLTGESISTNMDLEIQRYLELQRRTTYSFQWDSDLNSFYFPGGFVPGLVDRKIVKMLDDFPYYLGTALEAWHLERPAQ